MALEGAHGHGHGHERGHESSEGLFGKHSQWLQKALEPLKAIGVGIAGMAAACVVFSSLGIVLPAYMAVIAGIGLGMLTQNAKGDGGKRSSHGHH